MGETVLDIVLRSMSTRSGPQEERSKRIELNADLGTVESREVVLPIDFRSQEQTYHRKIQQLQKENEFLRNYTERALTELKNTLTRHGDIDKVQNISAMVEETVQDTSSPPTPPWFTSEEYMNPILIAYDLRLQEMESAYTESKTQIEQLATKTESIIIENEQLQMDLSTAMDKLVVRAESETIPDPQTGRITSVADSEELSELRERVDLLWKENNLIMEQNAGQETDIQHYQAQIAEKDKQLIDMSQKFAHVTRAINQLRSNGEQVALERDQCEQKLQHFAAQAALFENEKEDAERQLQVAKAAAVELKKRLREYELAIEQMNKNSNDGQDALLTKHKSLVTRIRELTIASEDKENENQELQQVNAALTGELDSVRTDCEGMLKVLNNMEKQLSEYASRQDTVTNLEKSCKNKAEEALLERDQAKASATHLKKEVSRLLEQKKINAVENVKKQEEAIAEVKERLNLRIKSYQNEISNLNQEIVELKVHQEQASRDKDTAIQDLSNVKGLQNSERNSIKDKYNKLFNRITEAESARDKAIIDENRMADQLESKSREFESKKNEILMASELLKDKISSLERELEVRRSELRELQQEKDEKERRIDKLTNQLSDSRVEFNNQLNHQQEVYQEQILDQKNRLFHTESELMKIKEKFDKNETTYRLEHDRIVKKKAQEIDQLNESSVRLREDKIRLESQTQDLSVKVTTLSAQILSLQQQLNESEEQQVQLQTLLDDSERKSTDLASQLSMTLSKQQQQLRVEKETRTSLDRIKLEKLRMERELRTTKHALDELKRDSVP